MLQKIIKSNKNTRKLFIIMDICIPNIEIHDFGGLKFPRKLNTLTDNLIWIPTLNKPHIHSLAMHLAKVNTILA